MAKWSRGEAPELSVESQYLLAVQFLYSPWCLLSSFVKCLLCWDFVKCYRVVFLFSFFVCVCIFFVVTA